jgi:hypothetical protein
MLLGTGLKFLDFGWQMPKQIVVTIQTGLCKTDWEIREAKYKYYDKKIHHRPQLV